MGWYPLIYPTSLRHDSQFCGAPTLVKGGLTYNDKSNILNQHFYSVFKGLSLTLPDMGPSPYPSFDISAAGVAKLLQGVDPFKATGPDRIPPRLLKEMSYELAPGLTLIFSASS